MQLEMQSINSAGDESAENDLPPIPRTPSYTNQPLYPRSPGPSAATFFCRMWRSCKHMLCGSSQKGGFASSGLFIILFGQFMSFMVAAGFASLATLRLDCKLSAPTLSITPLYLSLSLFLIPLYCQRRADNSNVSAEHKKTDEKDIESDTNPSDMFPQLDTNHTFLYLIPISRPCYIYIILALADMYAQIFMIWAFRYTTITSVAVMDALAIPSAMILSRCWFGRSYSPLHFVGVAACMIGIFLNVFQDYEEDQKGQVQTENQNDLGESYPHKALGDALGFFGGVLFGISNTIAEHLVRDVRTAGSHEIARYEYLSMMGVIASICCIVQICVLEQDEIKDFFFSARNDQSCSNEKISLLWLFFSFCCVMGYVGTARFLQVSEAVFYNLSLLTGDFWCVGFQVFEEHITPLPLFYPSLVLIISGTLIYEMAVSPVSNEDHCDDNDVGGDGDGDSHHGYLNGENDEGSGLVSTASTSWV
eukprot:CAMPEP_0198141944 /NCGR_PEP_ID=MMETSP1443-20131203/4860_1 /TAXON_ID=186043 /ORGANISM="Entomoneis sp., Strain CCMP2396" /LENGTH=476 /DNA_ID=CAMNT_0043804837 /DNA_START=93 /DNA_END=1523 /DNA_ORIENTATION=+